MAQQLPVIPVLDAIQFFEYITANWTGWPTPENPYAVGSAYQLAAGDNEQVHPAPDARLLGHHSTALSRGDDRKVIPSRLSRAYVAATAVLKWCERFVPRVFRLPAMTTEEVR